MASSPLPDLSILIVNFNGGPLLARCLASLPAAVAGRAFEAIVVDNASDDNSLSLVERSLPQAPWLTVVRRPDNVGFAAASNQAAALAAGHHLLLLNPDTQCRPGSLATLLAYAEAQSTCFETPPVATPRANPAAPAAAHQGHSAVPSPAPLGAVGPRLVNADGSAQRSAWRGWPGLGSALVDALYVWKWPWLPGVRTLEARPPAVSGPAARAPNHEVDHLLGACILIPRPVWERVGPLDDGYFLFLEETDWCRRARDAGYRIVQLPAAEVLHHGQHSVYQVPEQSSPSYYRGYLRFVRRAGAGPGRLLLLRLILTLGILLRLLLWTTRLAGSRRSLAGRMLRGYAAALGVVLGAGGG